MQYSDVTTALAILAKVNDALGVYTFIQSPNFGAFLPRIIEYAEGRCYREIVPLATRTATASAQFQAGLRTLPLIGFAPQPVVVEGIAAIYPAGKTPATGQRLQFEMASLDFIDSSWPTESVTVDPSTTEERYWCLLDNQTIIVAPTMDKAYTVEATGEFRPAALGSPGVLTTYLSLFYPDVFLAACMISVAGFQRDFGAQSADPQMAVSWEGQYQVLKASAVEEEQRRRGQGMGWTPLPPTTPEAKEPRH